MQIQIIYTQTGVLLSKHPYPSWREIQNQYTDYMTSLGPWDAEMVILTKGPTGCSLTSSPPQSPACDNGLATCSNARRSAATPHTACTTAATHMSAAPIR